MLAQLLSFALATLAPQAPDEPQTPVAARLEVCALANEGFLLLAGEDTVLIDGFLSEPYSGYAALEDPHLAELLAARGPFASVDLALASHAHRDHFQPAPARAFLAAHPEALLVSSPQVLEALLADYAEAQELEPAERLRDVLPEVGQEERVELGGVRVDVLRLSHGTGRFALMQNLGHVITLGGVTALHVGDAAMVPETFAAYDLTARGIDVAFVPYWYFGDPDGRRIVEEHMRPARLVACHIPPGELAQVARDLAERFPDVLVPQQAMQRFEFADLPR